MKYRVALKKSKEGYSVSCPGLPGCWSQGKTEKEALENIQSAIREVLRNGRHHFKRLEDSGSGSARVDGRAKATRRQSSSSDPSFGESRFYNCHPGQAYRNDRRRSDHHGTSNNPVNEYTMGGIVRDAGLTIEQFKKLL